MNLPILSLLVFTPLAGAVILLFVPREQKQLIRWLGTVTAALPLVLVAVLWGGFDVSAAGMQFVERYPWIPQIGVDYAVGVDGISFSLLALTAIVGLMAAIASWGINKRVKDYWVFFLFLQTGILGVFVALDYILFFVFWEIMLVPMYFLIGIWGGPRREYAAIKFFIYTLVGSVILLIGILTLYLTTGAETFNILEIAERIEMIPAAWRFWIFLALFAGFAVKVPVVPFHTWLPDAHVEAPTPISMILAGVLLKTGGYGFLRISHFTLPEAAQAFAWTLGVLGIINMVYGALVALGQNDMKKLVAYSSIAHMGTTLLGLAAATPVALNGAMYMMIAHGVISPMMFFMVGVFYDRTHTREIPRLGGLYTVAPVAAVFMMFAVFANLGLPGLAGFIAEFFTFAGVLSVFPKLVYVGILGIIIVAAFSLWLIQRVLLGQPTEEFKDIPDISPREISAMVPLMAVTLLLGVMPRLLIAIINSPLVALADRLVGGM